MTVAAALTAGLLCLVPLLEYHWITSGGFSLGTGLFFTAAAWFLGAGPMPFYRGKSFLFRAGAGLLFPWGIKALLFLLSRIFTNPGSYLFLLFDTDFSLLLPLYYGLFLFCLIGQNRPETAPYLLSLLMLTAGGALIFYKDMTGEGNLKITLPGTAAFLLPGIFYLTVQKQRILRHRRSLLRRGQSVSLLILLFFAGGLFLLRSYEEKSVAREGGGLLESDLFQFDFSEVLKLQSEISLSDELVMLFRKEGEGERLLIRRHVLDRYEEGRGFFLEEKPVEVPAGGIRFEDPLYRDRRDVNQEYYLINMNPSVALGLNYPVEIIPYEEWEDSSFQRILRTTSRVSEVSWWNLLGEKEIVMDGEERRRYTDYAGREDIAALAAEITADRDTPVEKALAVERYLRSNYRYSLRPGSSPYSDQLGYFLFVSQKGYCSYFAFAMTLMLRSQDIPARVAVGFWVDPDSEVLNFYPVAAHQAHAWVEVYFNEWGWIEFDPTSSTMAEGENVSFGRVDYEEYGRLIEEIIHNESDLAPEVPPSAYLRMTESFRRAAARAQALKGLLILFFILIYGALVLLSRAFPRGGASPRKRVSAAYVRIRKELFRTGLRGKGEETPLEYARRLERVRTLSLVPLTELYLKSEFSPRFGQEDEARFKELQRE
ncbi:MAG: transglutaminase domain-containing protein, partial [Spirochaetales bacterium]|nr:transglutaminase domain-containing protein [Spirochaetales bacterium]